MKARRIVRILARTVFAGAEAMWRTRCNLAAGSGNVRIAITKKMKQQAKVAAILQQIKMTHVAHLVEATVAQILSRPESQIDSWIRTNEELLRKLKKDNGQRTINWYFTVGRGNIQEEG